MRILTWVLTIICLFSTLSWAGEITRYYCPKCGSYDVVIEVEKVKPVVVDKSLDEWAKESFPSTFTLEVRHTKYIGICKKCGYKVEKYYQF